MTSKTLKNAAMTTAAHHGEPVPAPRLGIALIALAAVALELAFSARYGYVRDELYFLAAGQHLAPGYVDQPALTPLLARFSSIVLGNTVVGLRVLPALSLGVIVLLTAAMSRRLGAGRAGQLLAAAGAATCAQYLGAAHEMTTAVPDFVLWAGTLYLVVRLLDSGDPRWWLAIGLTVGVSSAAKWNIALLVASLAAGFAATDARRLLRSRYLLAACVIAAALAAPDLIWQAAHGWPAMDVFRVLQQSAGHNRATYWAGQVLFTGLALTPVWVTGLVWTMRSPAARPFRPAAIGCGLVVLLQFVLGGKPYYPGGAYSFLLAAGSVPIGTWLAQHGSRVRLAAMVALLASAAAIVPVALPVLPARVLQTVPLQKINYDLGEEIGWQREVALVAREYRALPAGQRRVTTILAGNYGEAGALARFGPADGLPAAYSGANNFWLWGPPPARDIDVIAVNPNLRQLRREFTTVRLVATYTNGLGVSDDEEGVQIYVAAGLRSSWVSAWPAFRDYA
jgi:4-amino-4-deoxy-L-arabinose transferase-like glycosyltransferase